VHLFTTVEVNRLTTTAAIDTYRFSIVVILAMVFVLFEFWTFAFFCYFSTDKSFRNVWLYRKEKQLSDASKPVVNMRFPSGAYAKSHMPPSE